MRHLFTLIFSIAMLPAASQIHAEPHWQVIEADSTLSFRITIGGSETWGSFEEWSAEITYDPAAPADALVAVEVAIKSALIESPQAAPLLVTAQWLDASGHPTARFIGRGFELANEQGQTLSGMLSLKGFDVPIRLLGSIDIRGDTARALFETTLSRTAFDVGDGNPAVADLVEVQVTINAIRIRN